MNYPIVLKSLIARWADRVIIHASRTVSWEYLAQRVTKYGNDTEQEHLLKENILTKGLEKNIKVFQDESHPDVKKYYATVAVMNITQLEYMLYEAYLKGFYKGSSHVDN